MNIFKRLAALLANSNLLGGASSALPPRDGKGSVVYARSSQVEVDDASLDRQVEICAAYAEAKGLRVEAIYADRRRCRTDGALNDGLDRMMRDVGGGGFGVVIVENLDRMARDLGSLENIFRTLHGHGVSIHVPGRGALRAEDVFMRGLRGDEARRIVSERVRFGRDQMAREGRFGGPCFGYRAATGKPGGWVVDEVQAATVRSIFEMRAGGLSHAAILADLQSGAVGDGAKRFGLRRLREILGNWRYAGLLVFNRTATTIDPATGRRRTIRRPASEWIVTAVPEARIVDGRTWDQVRAREADEA
jgi:DNA invertase Pin-like site-specific DNA recombinase